MENGIVDSPIVKQGSHTDPQEEEDDLDEIAQSVATISTAMESNLPS